MTIEWQIQSFDSLESTQDKAIEEAKKGAEEGTVIQALTQTKGRGRHRNEWNAPEGNIYLTYILRPDYDLRMAGQVSFIAALAVAETLAQYINEDQLKVNVKWPNDVLVDGLKISGILLESDADGLDINYLIIGVGINIANRPINNSVCLNDITGNKENIDRIRDQFLDKFLFLYEHWRQAGFGPIREQWLSRAYKLNEVITARLPNETYQGVFQDITHSGALVLKDHEGVTHEIHAAEIYFEEAA
ncbi:MAG: biotin--[acetyl-CoA-carboxylase] ligase [Pseudomonadota bacterium]